MKNLDGILKNPYLGPSSRKNEIPSPSSVQRQPIDPMDTVLDFQLYSTYYLLLHQWPTVLEENLHFDAPIHYMIFLRGMFAIHHQGRTNVLLDKDFLHTALGLLLAKCFERRGQ